MIAELLVASALLSAPDTARIEIRAGLTPTMDGVLAPGEWDDAGRTTIEVEPGWSVEVRYKHDGAYLHFAFSGLRRGAEERYPEVLLDTRGDGGAAWGEDDRWFHASYRDCDGEGRPNDYSTCAADRPGWKANNFPLEGDAGVVEMAVAYARIGLVPGSTRTLGIAFDVTDTRERWHFWPKNATMHSPATWALAGSPDRWGGLAVGGRLDTLRVEIAVLGDTLMAPVYLPPGYDLAKRHRVIYAVFDGVWLSHPGVRLPATLDSLVAAGGATAVLVGVPGASAADAHHPDTPAGHAYRRAVTEELVAAVERSFAVGRRPEDRLLLGFSSGANVAVELAARRPDLFGRVAAVSPGWMDAAGPQGGFGRVFLDEALEAVRAPRTGPRPAYWFVWGDGDMEWEARSREHGAVVMEALRAGGVVVERGADVAGEHGLHQAVRSAAAALGFLLGG